MPDPLDRIETDINKIRPSCKEACSCEKQVAARDALAAVEELRRQIEPEPEYCPECGSCGIVGCCHTKRCKYLDEHQGDYDYLVKENDQLRDQVAELTAALLAARPQIGRCSSSVCDQDGHKHCAWGLAKAALARLKQEVPHA